MPRDNGSSFEACLVLLVILAGVLIFFFPPAAPIVLVCIIPTVVISLYLRRTSKSQAEEITSQRTTFGDRADQQKREEMQADAMAAATRAFPTDVRTTRPDISARPTPRLMLPRAQAEKEPASVKNLEARISELEERVRLLRERLATGLTTDTITPSHTEPNGKPPKSPLNEEPEELSERALRQLLEALDEKLAKGAISQQLYQRLRDKYLARLGKARGKRDAPPEAAPSKPRRR